jgi:hypothetical protein
MTHHDNGGGAGSMGSQSRRGYRRALYRALVSCLAVGKSGTLHKPPRGSSADR